MVHVHECIHRTAFATRCLNDAAAWACGALLMLPPEYFRLFHFAHHRFTQDPARDPELATPRPATLASYLWHVSHSTVALLYWALPALLGQPLLRLFLLAEHAGCAMTDDMLANTRTTCSNGALRLLTWRMPYHAEHHCFPAVPFHGLAGLHALMGARVRTRTAGYLAVHRSLLRQLRG